jgi:tRNA dimethylallyltransferase
VKVIIISGPTASGKTAISLELASRLGGEIVNFDSLLLYKEINIGTAKPEAHELAAIPHHMINVRSISDPMTAADYSRQALPIVEHLLSQGKLVYLVGGSGFYLQALLKGMYASATPDEEVLNRSEQLYLAEGIAPFRAILEQHDPASWQRYHENDHYRIRRAVEHWWSTGNTFSGARKMKDEENRQLSGPSIHDWEILHLHLDLPKPEHLEVIQARTQRMLSGGLLQEAQELMARGFTGAEKPLQSIGYKEIFAYLKGEFESLDACKERIVISTRQLAKSQRTWFKRDQSKLVFHPLRQRSEILAEVEKFLAITKDQESL